MNEQGRNVKKVKQRVKELMKDVSKIEEESLREQVREAIREDAFYSTLLEKVKEREGLEYEFKLKQKLENITLQFLSEPSLRQLGFSKTPDFKLVVPIMIEGKVINWIESKASFGDFSTHSHFLSSQFWSYYDRFGPGLIIYWFGFIQQLPTHSPTNPSLQCFVVMDHFPLSFATL